MIITIEEASMIERIKNLPPESRSSIVELLDRFRQETESVTLANEERSI